MKTLVNGFNLSSLTIAMVTALSAAHVNAEEASAEDIAMEEVVVKASRLKGTATAVLEERKNQAFVADILGAEQIARTGDSDAAAALRRVTGLTLVDGKYIYVRGLGERYSSTMLNGAVVPSPDPTRTVIPLDLFPAPIIESLSVQKSYSPSMPAHFGGGNVDVRLKSIPTDFVMNVAGSLGGNTNNFDDGITYSGGGTDWIGIDDGTREAPSTLQEHWRTYQSINDLSQEANRPISADMNRDYDPTKEKVNPDIGLDFTLGNSWESGDFRYGFLASTSYDNEWQVSEQYVGEEFRENSDGTWSMIRGFDDIIATEHTVKWSGMLSLGIEYDKNHRIDFSSTLLHDTNDEIQDRYGNTENASIADGLRIRNTVAVYEEREMFANQLRGSHNLTEFWNLGIDWKYSVASSSRYAPGANKTRYVLSDANEDGIFDPETESSLSKGNSTSRYLFQDLDDDVTNYGFNISLPLHYGNTDIELKAGADSVEKNRSAFGRKVDINTLAFKDLDMSGNRMNDILTDDVMLYDPLNTAQANLLVDTSSNGDDYDSEQTIDAYYFEADLLIDNTWRIGGGLRFEDFKQQTTPYKPSTGEIDIDQDDDIADYIRQEDGLYPALALTYIQDEEMQWRLTYGETVVRPDIRESAPARYRDPLTDFPVQGTPGVETTEIKNYDFRWEWYLDTGENLSIGLFYKDMLNPIEAIQSPAQDGPALIRIANADNGEVYGIEMEFLKDFNFLGGIGQDLFMSGNVTISESEITIDRERFFEQTGVSSAITNTTRRMTGHSPYVLNLNLGYDAPNGNHSAMVAYNVFGERIIVAGIEGRGDAYEQPFHSLDAVYTYYPTYESTLKFKLKNILNQDKELTFDDTLLRSKTIGTDFEVSFRWEF